MLKPKGQKWKVTGKKVSGKKLEIQTLVKKSQFSQEIRWQELKSSWKSLVKMKPSLRRYYEKDFFSKHLHFELYPGMFLFLLCCKHPLFPCIFYYNRIFFPVTFLYKINTWDQKKSPRKKSLKIVGLYFQRLFISRTFSTGFFLVPKFKTLFRKTFFRELFWRLPFGQV